MNGLDAMREARHTGNRFSLWWLRLSACLDVISIIVLPVGMGVLLGMGKVSFTKGLVLGILTQLLLSALSLYAMWVGRSELTPTKAKRRAK